MEQSKELRAVASYTEKQSEIIRLQTEIIDDLAAALLMHVSSGEMGMMPCWSKMQAVTAKKEKLEER